MQLTYQMVYMHNKEDRIKLQLRQMLLVCKSPKKIKRNFTSQESFLANLKESIKELEIV